MCNHFQWYGLRHKPPVQKLRVVDLNCCGFQQFCIISSDLTCIFGKFYTYVYKQSFHKNCNINMLFFITFKFWHGKSSSLKSRSRSRSRSRQYKVQVIVYDFEIGTTVKKKNPWIIVVETIWILKQDQ